MKCPHNDVIIPFPNRTCQEHHIWLFVQCLDCGLVLLNPKDAKQHKIQGPVQQATLFNTNDAMIQES